MCVSCANRFYERLKGKNAKGNAPVNLPPLDARRIGVRSGDGVSVYRLEYSLDTTELMVAKLRDSAKQVQFGFVSAVRGDGVQLRLF